MPLFRNNFPKKKRKEIHFVHGRLLDITVILRVRFMRNRFPNKLILLNREKHALKIKQQEKSPVAMH